MTVTSPDLLIYHLQTRAWPSAGDKCKSTPTAALPAALPTPPVTSSCPSHPTPPVSSQASSGSQAPHSSHLPWTASSGCPYRRLRPTQFWGFKGMPLKSSSLETSLVVQWLRLWAPNAGVLGPIPGQRTRSCMPQLNPSTVKKKKKKK